MPLYLVILAEKDSGHQVYDSNSEPEVACN